MTKGRLEAFSDGVLAIVITIMVLEMHVPESASWAAIQTLVPMLISYVLSYVFVGIYWSNHHHLLQAVEHIDGRVLWANLHLLFWLTLIPFLTRWMGETSFSSAPVAAYGVVLLCAAIAYYILARTLLSLHEKGSTIQRAMKDNRKEILSIVIYALAIPVAFWLPLVSYVGYNIVAIMWLVPDRRIERVIDG